MPIWWSDEQVKIAKSDRKLDVRSVLMSLDGSGIYRITGENFEAAAQYAANTEIIRYTESNKPLTVEELTPMFEQYIGFVRQPM